MDNSKTKDISKDVYNNVMNEQSNISIINNEKNT